MKTRNWKLCTLVIFLAVCFTFYAGNCYPQRSWTSQVPDLPIFDPDPWSWQIYNPYPGPIYDPFTPIYELPSSYSYPGPIYDPYPFPYPIYDPFTPIYELPLMEFRQPVKLNTFGFLEELIPSHTYNRTYNMTDFTGINYGFDSYDFMRPITKNWNPYQQIDTYVLPGSQKQKLFQFTKEFEVQPIMPDIWMSYGGGMSGMLY